MAKLHDKHQFAVHVEGLLVHLVGVALVVFLDQWAQGVLSHDEEIGHGAMTFEAHLLAQGAALDADERLRGPLVAIEQPSGQHLVGRQPFVGTGAVDLLAEVEGVGLHRADAVVVEHAEAPQLVGGGAGHGGLGPAACGQGEEQQAHERPFAQQVAAEHTAVRPLGVDEHEEQGEEKQGIAGIGDGYAPGVAVHGQHRSMAVGVVARLIETIGTVGEDVVHRHAAPLPFVAIDHGKHRFVVGRGAGAGMIGGLKPLEL